MTDNARTAVVPGTERLASGALGAPSIVFMVVAVSAPLAVVVALLPIAFAYGNGAGVPGAFVIAVLALLLFAAGYVKIIPYIRNAGAFYAYIAAGMGRALGLSAAFVSAMAYFALCASTLAATAYFCGDLFLQVTGIETHWSIWALLAGAIVAFFAYNSITWAALVLAVILVTEIGIILLLDLAILIQAGFPAYDIGDLSPAVVFGPGLGIALIYAFNGMAGIEGTAIYQEEAKDRTRTVPLATFIALILVGVFYFITSWSLSASVDGDVAAVAAADPGGFVITQAGTYLGAWSASLFSVLVITSGFAASLGLFNNASRYLYALSRDGVVWRGFAQTHKRHQSPHVAAIFMFAVLVVVILASAASGLDPLLNVSPAFIGIGSVSLMALIVLTSFSIPIFFARRGEYSLQKTVAPVIGGIVVLVATFLAVTNYGALTGVDNPLVNNMIWIIPIFAVIGLARAAWLKAQRPEIYAMIGSSRVEG